MKLSILQENLVQAVGTAGRAASAKASLPILNHLLLVTDQGRLKISATNLEIGVSSWVGAKVEKEGSLAVPARVLQELVGSLPPGKLDLEVIKGNLHIAAGSVEANISGIEGSEFPAIPSFPKVETTTLPALDLARAIDEVAYAAAAEEGRPVLTGVLWRVKGPLMELVATDGYRLAYKKVSLPEGGDKSWQVVVPARALQEMARAVSELAARGEAPEEVRLALNEGENQISFALGNVELTSRLIEGNYPSFEQIIPDGFAARGLFAKDDLVQAVRLATVFARDLGNIVRLKLAQSGLELSANTAQVGDERTEVPGDISGEEIDVAFNSRYLLDALGRFQKSQVSLEIKSSLSPGVFRAVGDDSLTVLVMPVRLQG